MISASVQSAMLAAADAAGSHVVRARASFVAANLREGIAMSAVQPGRKLALLRCTPPPCVELWVVSDLEMTDDWQVSGG